MLKIMISYMQLKLKISIFVLEKLEIHIIKIKSERLAQLGDRWPSKLEVICFDPNITVKTQFL